ncbi:MAG: cell division protein FtsZ, partial [Bacteroidaceae bacterium]|nr:cell division protein FtsZ [Bacteroidaceae bacterium]
EAVEQQNREKAAEDEEKKAKEEERREMFYSNGGTTTARRRHHNIYIFSDADLDNDDVISMVETLPTYRRTKDELNRIKNKESQAQVPQQKPSIEEGGFQLEIQ